MESSGKAFGQSVSHDAYASLFAWRSPLCDCHHSPVRVCWLCWERRARHSEWEKLGRSTEKMLQAKSGEISMSSQGEMQLQQEVERDFPERTTELGKSARKMLESRDVNQPG